MLKQRKYSIGFVCLFIIMVIMITGLWVQPTHAASIGNANKKNAVYVLFDDSGSMSEGYKWSRAKYALEVLTAMLDENDVLRAYSINDYNRKSDGIIDVSGNDKSRVATIHSWVPDAGNGTPWGSIGDANTALSTLSADFEKWIVILTDDGCNEQSQIEVSNKAGINVIVLSIVGDINWATRYKADNFYYLKAVSSSEILNKVTDAANIIQNHLQLPDRAIKKSGSAYTFDLDIPTERIIVFAQGDNVQIGMLSDSSGKQIQPFEKNDVKHYESRVISEIDRSLKGVVAIYASGQKAYAADNYTLDIQGADSVVVYYEPAVEVDCDLYQDGKLIAKGTTITAGDFTAQGSFVDPITGKSVKSELLDQATFSLCINNNGVVTELGKNGGKVSLKSGNATITAIATFPNGVRLETTKSYKVIDVKLALDLSGNLGANDTLSIRQDKLRNASAPFTIALRNNANNGQADETIWNNTAVTVTTAHGVEWSVTKGTKAPDIVLTPKATGSINDVELGLQTFTYSAVYNNDPATEVSGSFDINIYKYEPVIIEDMTVSFDQKDFSGAHSKTVPMTVKDGYVDELKDIWQYVTLSDIPSQEGLSWSITKGNAGQYTLTCASLDGKMRSVKAGTYTIPLTVTYDDGEYVYAESGTMTVNVNECPPITLLLEYTVPTDPYQQSRFHIEDNPPILVTVKTENGSVISNELWNFAGDDGLTVETVDAEQKVDFKVRMGTNVGTWEIQPVCYGGKGYRTANGSILIKGNILTEKADDLYEGSGNARFEITEEYLWCALEWLIDNAWWIITSLVVFYLYMGYYGKKMRLVTKNVKLVLSIDGKNGIQPLEYKIKRDMATVITPWPFCKTQKAYVKCNEPSFFCTFPNFTIIAAGKKRSTSSFYLDTTNLKTLDFGKYEINGNTSIDSAEKLAEMKFRLGGFYIYCNASGKRNVGLIKIAAAGKKR